MAKTNAERQAAYRQRRNSERITEEDLKLMLFHAYMLGRADLRKGKDIFEGTTDAARWKQEIYDRTCEDAAGTALDLDRKYSR